MVRLLLRLALRDLVIFAVPFVVYFVWSEVARRTGRPMGSTPWAWLVAAGLVFAGLSMMSGAFWYRSHRGETYVPAESGPNGSVIPGHFEK